METILFLAHTEADGTLAKPALEALGAATDLNKQLCGTLAVGLYGAEAQAAANAVGTCGAQQFLSVSGEDFAQPRYATDAAACEALIRASGATIVIAAGTSRNARVMAGVAHRVNGNVDTHVIFIDAGSDSLTITRWFYRQRIEGSLSRTTRPWILLLDPGAHSAWQGESASVSIEAVAVAVPETLRRTTLRGTVTPPADQQTIRPDAKLLFVAGAGWTKKQKDGQTHVAEAETLIVDFLKRSKASLGGSKSLVDLTGENQSGSALHDAPQSGRPDGRIAAASQRSCHVLPWRGAAHRGLAIHRRKARDQPRPELRLGPRQGRCALRGRRIRSDF